MKNTQKRLQEVKNEGLHSTLVRMAEEKGRLLGFTQGAAYAVEQLAWGLNHSQAATDLLAECDFANEVVACIKKSNPEIYKTIEDTLKPFAKKR